jgi:peptidoglycan/xylan/chitin deacetylase (PgdA/CDA1 family)
VNVPQSGLSDRARGVLIALGAIGVAAVGLTIAATAPDGGRTTAVAAGPGLPMPHRHVAPRPHLRPDRRPVPVLMYHEIDRYRGGPIYSGLYVRPRTFARQLRWLARHRFRAVTLARVEDAWAGRARLPRRPVVISFDDGYRSVYEHAFPRLRRRHWPAVLNLATGNLYWYGGLSPRRVRRLIRAGWELASHTIHHVSVRGASRRTLHVEVAASRELLRRMFHVPVRNFAYPEGKWDRQAAAAVRSAGYTAAAGIMPGLARPGERFHVDRIRVDESDGVRGLRRKLRAQGLP